MMTDHNKDMARMAETMHRAMCEIPQPDVDAAWRDMEKRMQRRGGIGLRKRWLGTAAALAVGFAVSGGLYVLVDSRAMPTAEVTEPVTADSCAVLGRTMVFEDATLGDVLGRVAAECGVSVVFESPEKSDMRMHLAVDSGMTADDFVVLINNFESIDARIVTRDSKKYIEIR